MVLCYVANINISQLKGVALVSTRERLIKKTFFFTECEKRGAVFLLLD